MLHSKFTIENELFISIETHYQIEYLNISRSWSFASCISIFFFILTNARTYAMILFKRFIKYQNMMHAHD